MTCIKKPMLAGKCEDATKLKYPVYATPKLDGIRCLALDNKALSRSFKPIPNKHIFAMIAKLPNGLDGEIMVGENFQNVSSGVMSEDGAPEFEYHVFDYVKSSLDRPYLERIEDLKKLKLPAFVKVLIPEKVNNVKELRAYEKKQLKLGYEGIMIRTGEGRYKEGRSGNKEGILLKLKKFVDSEAEVIGFEEQMENTNEAFKDELGHTKRSTAKAGMKPAGTLGTILARDLYDKREFGIGTGKGLDDALRQEIWNNRSKYMGKIIKYAYQKHGSKNKPRIPTFEGFRDVIDL